MPLLNRATLQNLFSRGSRPTEQHFADLIEATANKVDDGFSVTPEHGLCLAPLDNHKNLISVFRSTKEREAAFTFSLNPYPHINGLKVSDQEGHVPMFLKQGGNVGIHTLKPGFAMEVGGYVGMRGRAGTYANGQVPADSYWQPIVSGLDGLQAFEVTASVNRTVSRYKRWLRLRLSLGKNDNLRRRDVRRFCMSKYELNRWQVGRIRIHNTYSIVHLKLPGPLRTGFEDDSQLEIGRRWWTNKDVKDVAVNIKYLGLKWNRIHINKGKIDGLKRKHVRGLLKNEGYISAAHIGPISRRSYYTIVRYRFDDLEMAKKLDSGWKLEKDIKIKQGWFKRLMKRMNEEERGENRKSSQERFSLMRVICRSLQPDEMRTPSRGAFVKAIALAAYEGRGSHNKIKARHSGRLWDRVYLRWVGDVHNYELQARTLFSYGYLDAERSKPVMIDFQVSQLWSDTLTLNNREE